MRVVFMGGAELSCPSLEILAADARFNVTGVVTQPDRPRGRKLVTAANRVKETALAHGLPVISPERVNCDEGLSCLAEWAPDVIAVVAFGQFLSTSILELPPHGCVNVHTSLLPRYRGAAPIQWAVANGDTVTGVTTMLIDEGMDSGDILLQREVAIGPEETAGELHDRLAVLGADLLAETLAVLAAGEVRPVKQDESLVTFAPKLKKTDGNIDWQRPAPAIVDRVRGFNPWPGSFCYAPGGGDPLKVHRAAIAEGLGTPGQILSVSDGLVVAAGEGAVRLETVQPAGRREMSGADFLRGHPLNTGDNFKIV